MNTKKIREDVLKDIFGYPDFPKPFYKASLNSGESVWVRRERQTSGHTRITLEEFAEIAIDLALSKQSREIFADLENWKCDLCGRGITGIENRHKEVFQNFKKKWGVSE